MHNHEQALAPRWSNKGIYVIIIIITIIIIIIK